MAALEKPRRVLMMVPAGRPVDDAIAHLKPHLEPGDILIDGGNSWFLDTERRSRQLATEGFNYIGTGVSGGEEGALWGPSIMPGGQVEAWEALAPILRAIAAKADDGAAVRRLHGAARRRALREDGAQRHRVRRHAAHRRGLRPAAAAGSACRRRSCTTVFAEWNDGRAQVVPHRDHGATCSGKVDAETGRPMVDLILDEAAQKGTGKWTSQNALDIGAPIPTINAAVESRILSSLKAERVAASKVLAGPSPRFDGARQRAHRRGARRALRREDHLVRAGARPAAAGVGGVPATGCRPGAIARIWRAGCIIRATLLGDISAAYGREPSPGEPAARRQPSARPSSRGRRRGGRSCRPPSGSASRRWR